MADYSRELNKGLKIFSQLYVGLKPQSDHVALGFATPFENNAAFRKRKTTVDSWAGWTEYVRDPENPGRYKVDVNGRAVIVEHPANTKVVDNVPREGFKVTDSLKRVYWGGGNVVWRIEDPLGFELEIQSNNLLAIIQNCDLESGVIKGKCLWARDGKDNILIHESSEEYKNAFKAAETLKAPATVPMAERVRGAKYLLKNGSEAIYMGRMYAYLPLKEDADSWYGRQYLGSANKSLPAQFVSIPNAMPVSHAHYHPFRSAGCGTIVAETRYFGGTVEQFDVVADQDLNTFYFYAKSGAPLVRRLDETCVDVPDSIQRITESTNLKFAGNRNEPILYAQIAQFSSVDFGIRQPCDREKKAMLDKLDAIEQQYKHSYYNKQDSLRWALRNINRVGDGFIINSQPYQYCTFTAHDTREITYSGPQIMVLKARVEQKKLCISEASDLVNFGNANYAIGNGPVSPEDAGIEFFEGTRPSSVSEAVQIAKERIENNMMYVINYIAKE